MILGLQNYIIGHAEEACNHPVGFTTSMDGTMSEMLDERAAILSRTTIIGVFHQCVRVVNARANRLHQHCMVVGIET